jgi:hypothetical protein
VWYRASFASFFPENPSSTAFASIASLGSSQETAALEEELAAWAFDIRTAGAEQSATTIIAVMSFILGFPFQTANHGKGICSENKPENPHPVDVPDSQSSNDVMYNQ